MSAERASVVLGTVAPVARRGPVPRSWVCRLACSRYSERSTAARPRCVTGRRRLTATPRATVTSCSATGTPPTGPGVEEAQRRRRQGCGPRPRAVSRTNGVPSGNTCACHPECSLKTEQRKAKSQCGRCTSLRRRWSQISQCTEYGQLRPSWCQSVEGDQLSSEPALRSHRTTATSLGHDLDGEFDPGSGRTLAACLTHASRTGSNLSQDRGRPSGERVSNT